MNCNPENSELRKILFVKFSPDGVAYSVFYTGPRNATICLGVSNSVIRVAYAPKGGMTTHSDLLPIAAPTRYFQAVRAALRSDLIGNSTVRTFEIYKSGKKPPEGFSSEPGNVLDKESVTVLCRKLGANSFVFKKD